MSWIFVKHLEKEGGYENEEGDEKEEEEEEEVEGDWVGKEGRGEHVAVRGREGGEGRERKVRRRDTKDGNNCKKGNRRG